jgi:uncharacterized protein (TIGR03435 family)
MVPIRSAGIPSTTLAPARAIALAALVSFAAIGLRASQLPTSAPLSGQVRVSNRTASNRIWFQTASLMPSRGDAAPPGATLEVVAANGVTLREFIGFAYMDGNGALTRTQVIGGPEWLDTQRFDVIVPTPGNLPNGLTRDADQIATGGAAIPLLRQLLADHFKLRVHTERRMLPALNLMASNAASAPDLKPTTATCNPADAAQRCDFRSGPGFMASRGMTMRFLAMQLSWNFPALKLPVVDKSGLTGRYDYTLSFTPAFLVAPNPRDPNVANPAAGTGASLQQALEQRLGLTLVDAMEMFGVVVIDSVEPLS